MGLLDNTTQKAYYEGNNFGNYQFTSLEDIINQFIIVYVGEEKIISKTNRTDVAFHAQRALQELSFDTFKSIKSQQIDLPPSLTMVLPHDYVNYTKISSVDAAGIKHPLYPTNSTSNPFQIRQETDGSYSFPEDDEEVVDGDFAVGNFTNWQKNPDINPFGTTFFAKTEITSNKTVFSHRSRTNGNYVPNIYGHAMAIWQELDVSDKEYLTLSADGQAVDFTNNLNPSTSPGFLRVGISTSIPDSVTKDFVTSNNGDVPTTNSDVDIFDLSTVSGADSYLEWTTSSNTTTKEISGINVVGIDTVYVVAVSFHDFSSLSVVETTLTATNNVDNISVTNSLANDYLSSPTGNKAESSTWKNYKSNSPSENQQHAYDYDDQIFEANIGRRYGLEPSHAQDNGSFYMDDLRGKIHFSSNIKGQTVILDYISDSLGTDGEMQVHKFAEEAMYKSIIYAILSTRSNIAEYIVRRYKKERFAAIRQAKLRLSNLKLEELTQILRGKSKWIKH